jgi:molybdopterin-guanine dinucleotide biosynthesis protein A
LDVSCIILAGGKSTRLGRNKVVEKIGNQSLIEIVVSRLSALESDIIIVASKDSSLPQLTNCPRLKLANDIYPGRGSLGGIYTGLIASETLFNLVVACDMPFLNLDLLQYMVDRTEGYDAVIPKSDVDILEPLHAVYSKNCIPAIESLIKKDRFSILELYPLIKVKYIEYSEVERFDPDHLSFFNINTEEDLRVGKELLRRESKSD